MQIIHRDRAPSTVSGGAPSSELPGVARLAGRCAAGVLGVAVAAAVAATLIDRSTASLAPRGAQAAGVPPAAFLAAPEPVAAAAATPRPDIRHLPAASDGIYQPWECNDEKPC